MAFAKNPAHADRNSLPQAFIVALLVALLAVSAYIRVQGAAQYHYSPDDMMEIHIAAQKTLPDVLHTALHETAHPPLGYIVRHYWLQLFSTPLAIRCEALLWGLLLIPLYYFIGKELSGTLAGLFAATLIGFSQGCIVQSYVVRNYTLFLLLLSYSFYCYIRWHRLRNEGILTAYTGFGCLACLTHFSGMFVFFTITVCECIWLCKTHTSQKKHALWIVANLTIGIVGLIAYCAWQPLLQALGPSFAVAPKSLLAGAPIYPLSALGYLLPGIKMALALLFLGLLLLFLPNRTQASQLRFYLLLAGGELLLGTVLFSSGVYPFLGTRRSLWLLPCIIPVTAYVMADVCEQLYQRVAFFQRPTYRQLAALLFFTLLWLSYTPAQRFSDMTEYPLSEIQWQTLHSTLEAMPRPYLIIAEKDDSVLLQNPYPFISTDAYPDKNGIRDSELTALIPYRAEHILINPLYHRIFSADMLLRMLGYAQAHGMLDHADSFIFFHTPWSVYPIDRLMECQGIEKKALLFPPSTHTPLTHKDITHGFMLVIVTRDVLFNSILASSGAGHACLSGAHGERGGVEGDNKY
jgi:hypothetical protein